MFKRNPSRFDLLASAVLVAGLTFGVACGGDDGGGGDDETGTASPPVGARPDPATLDVSYDGDFSNAFGGLENLSTDRLLSGLREVEGALEAIINDPETILSIRIPGLNRSLNELAKDYGFDYYEQFKDILDEYDAQFVNAGGVAG